MFYVLCFMFYVLCFMFYVLCFMFYVLCFMFYVLCFMFCMIILKLNKGWDQNSNETSASKGGGVGPGISQPPLVHRLSRSFMSSLGHTSNPPSLPLLSIAISPPSFSSLPYSCEVGMEGSGDVCRSQQHRELRVRLAREEHPLHRLRRSVNPGL